MLRISDEQLDQALYADDRDLVEHVVAFLRQHCAPLVEGFPDQSLNRMTAVSLERARGHGLQGPEDLAHFAALMWEVAPNFDEQPEIAALLADPTLAHKSRLASVVERTPIDALYAAEAAHDASVWNPPAHDAGSPPSEQEQQPTPRGKPQAAPGTLAGDAQPQR
ncbi:MAG: hypothetical protein ACR2RL_01145 [Gammaproteobacteria bacterium]